MRMKNAGFELVLARGPHLTGQPANALLCIVSDANASRVRRIIKYMAEHASKNGWFDVFRHTILLWSARSLLNRHVDALVRQVHPADAPHYDSLRVVNPPIATDDAAQLCLWIEEMDAQLAAPAE